MEVLCDREGAHRYRFALAEFSEGKEREAWRRDCDELLGHQIDTHSGPSAPKADVPSVEGMFRPFAQITRGHLKHTIY